MSKPTLCLIHGYETPRDHDGLYAVHVEIEGMPVTSLHTSHSHITLPSDVRKKQITSIRSGTWNNKTNKMES